MKKLEKPSTKNKEFNKNHKSSIKAIKQKEFKWFRWDYDVKPGHIKIICPICNEICFAHKKRYKKECQAFEKLDMKWSCQNCREFDVRNLCRKINL